MTDRPVRQQGRQGCINNCSTAFRHSRVITLPILRQGPEQFVDKMKDCVQDMAIPVGVCNAYIRFGLAQEGSSVYFQVIYQGSSFFS